MNALRNHHPHHQSNAAWVPPLPKGEGRGEGEGSVRLPTVHNTARHVHQPTVHGDDAVAIWSLKLGTSLEFGAWDLVLPLSVLSTLSSWLKAVQSPGRSDTRR